jgi:hypothetical protein
VSLPGVENFLFADGHRYRLGELLSALDGDALAPAADIAMLGMSTADIAWMLRPTAAWNDAVAPADNSLASTMNRILGDNFDDLNLYLRRVLAPTGASNGDDVLPEVVSSIDDRAMLEGRVHALVQAMAAFAPPPMGQTALIAPQQAALGTLVATSWQSP